MVSSLIFADGNGIWHEATDIRGGVFGSDENDGVDFTFNRNIVYKGIELDSKFINSDGDTLSGDFLVSGKFTVSGALSVRGEDSDVRYINSVGDEKITGSLTVTDDFKVSNIFDEDDSSYFLKLAGDSKLSKVYSSVFYDLDDSSFGINPSSNSILKNTYSKVYFDLDDDSYFIDPAGTTYVNEISIQGQDSDSRYINNGGDTLSGEYTFNGIVNIGAGNLLVGGESIANFVENACVDNVWGPSTAETCEGEALVQTSNCGTTRSVTGSRDCTVACTDVTWSPTASNICKDVVSTQASNCGNSRQVIGTNQPGDWGYPARDTVCSGVSFTQRDNTCSGQTRTLTGTKPCGPSNVAGSKTIMTQGSTTAPAGNYWGCGEVVIDCSLGNSCVVNWNRIGIVAAGMFDSQSNKGQISLTRGDTVYSGKQRLVSQYVTLDYACRVKWDNADNKIKIIGEISTTDGNSINHIGLISQNAALFWDII